MSDPLGMSALIDRFIIKILESLCIIRKKVLASVLRKHPIKHSENGKVNSYLFFTTPDSQVRYI